MSGDDKSKIVKRDGETAPAASDAHDIASFLDAVKNTPAPVEGRGRLSFVLDATMSRQPTWDRAISLQADMFSQAAQLGGLSMQLVYFRGISECRASKWASDPARLGDMMSRIDCRGGHTQMVRAFSHVAKSAAKEPVAALVYVGDAMEEAIDDLCAAAGKLALRNVKAFMFQEGRDPIAANAFSEVARITGGVHEQFDSASAARLGDLLNAVAAYAAGGMTALEARTDSAAKLLTRQMKGQ